MANGNVDDVIEEQCGVDEEKPSVLQLSSTIYLCSRIKFILKSRFPAKSGFPVIFATDNNNK